MDLCRYGRNTGTKTGTKFYRDIFNELEQTGKGATNMLILLSLRGFTDC